MNNTLNRIIDAVKDKPTDFDNLVLGYETGLFNNSPQGPDLKEPDTYDPRKHSLISGMSQHPTRRHQIVVVIHKDRDDEQ
jgi:hypothetical protein